MEKISLRPYMESDEEALVKITEGKYLEELIGYSRNLLTIAEYDHTIAGWSYANIRSGKGMQSFVLVYVSKPFRRKGIGTLLYNQIESACVNSGSETLFTSYFDTSDAEAFTSYLNFSYSTSAQIMTYTGQLLIEKDIPIRKYQESDAIRFGSIWSKGSYELHSRLGLPTREFMPPTQEMIQEYNANAKNQYILETNKQIVGMGSIDDNMIGCLAVDAEFNNKGYGTALAIFLTNEILRRGNDTALLYCETGNHNALHVYQKLGYKNIYTEYNSIKNLQ